MGGVRGREDRGVAVPVQVLHDALPMMPLPTPTHCVSSRRASAPVQISLLLLPVHIKVLLINRLIQHMHIPRIIRKHLPVPMPETRIHDILETRDLALGENGNKVVRDADGVGAVEEGVTAGQRGAVADVGVGGVVCDEGEGTGVCVDGGIVGGVLGDGAGGAVRWAGQEGCAGRGLVGGVRETGKGVGVHVGSVGHVCRTG